MSYHDLDRMTCEEDYEEVRILEWLGLGIDTGSPLQNDPSSAASERPDMVERRIRESRLVP